MENIFDPELADRRFGCGLSPTVAPPDGPDEMLKGLTHEDYMSVRFPIETFQIFSARRLKEIRLNVSLASSLEDSKRAEMSAQRKQLKLVTREASIKWLCQVLLRRSHTTCGFRERLIEFWADHFTAGGKTGLLRLAMPTYVEETIRPRIASRFSELLFACVSHPLMLDFLDQHRSVGPNSARALRSHNKLGLNENLAREVLELHTLGANGSYKQTDVRHLALLFAGMSFDLKTGPKFLIDNAEPNNVLFLGNSYSEKPSYLRVRKVLDDLSANPATAHHIARKLATHFVSDSPPQQLVAHLTTRFLETNGDLMATYGAMLEHPASWSMKVSNTKKPIDFLGSACRALGAEPARIQQWDSRQLRRHFALPIRQMGQSWGQAASPDGWPEDDEHWITAQSLAARIQWAMTTPVHLLTELPDPRNFVNTALGRNASAVVQFAASAAESKPEAIGLVLASPAFQRLS